MTSRKATNSDGYGSERTKEGGNEDNDTVVRTSRAFTFLRSETRFSYTLSRDISTVV